VQPASEADERAGGAEDVPDLVQAGDEAAVRLAEAEVAKRAKQQVQAVAHPNPLEAAA
jgi:hypothetical protein